MVSQDTSTDADSPDVELSEGEGTDSTVDTPDSDLNSLRENVSANLAAAQFQADITAIKRATGHIPGLQSRLDSVERAAKRVETLESSNQQLATKLDALVSALSEGALLTPGVAQSLMSGRNDSNAELLAKLGDLEERITSGGSQRTQPEEDPATLSRRIELEAADREVQRYAQARGYTGDIPDAVFARALQANPDDLAQAVIEVAKYIDNQVAAQGRRAERKDAAAGGSGERSTRKSPVTADQLKNMSLAEVMAIPKEERDRIAAGG